MSFFYLPEPCLKFLYYIIYCEKKLYQCGVVIFVKYFLIQCFKLPFIHNDDGLVHERNCDFSFVVNIVLFT